MSDTDEFDKEAERERLREKYEADQRDREATQRMSELLLQGATMTNRHCDDCGDPVFRYDGQEFCPSCGAGTDAATTGGGAGPGRDAATTSTDGADPADAADSAADVAGGTGDDRRAAAGRGGTPPATHPAEGSAPGAGRSGDPEAGTGEPSARVGDTDAGDPRAALATAATRMARRAETADDPRQAREWLAAAREAADALAALDGRTGAGG